MSNLLLVGNYNLVREGVSFLAANILNSGKKVCYIHNDPIPSKDGLSTFKKISSKCISKNNTSYVFPNVEKYNNEDLFFVSCETSDISSLIEEILYEEDISFSYIFIDQIDPLSLSYIENFKSFLKDKEISIVATSERTDAAFSLFKGKNFFFDKISSLFDNEDLLYSQ